VSEDAQPGKTPARRPKGGGLAEKTRRGRAQPGRPEVDLEGLADHLGYLIRRAQLWVYEDFARTLAPLEIRPAQYSVMTVISANPGLTQMSVGVALGIERARLVYLLDELEARGFVTRKASATDRRSHALHLTADGTRALVRMQVLVKEHESRLAEKVGIEEHRMLVRMMSVFAKG
jgi:DNA-binding MarR family transcriptional regulator